MSETTILVIDDSATIRRLADSELSSAGYRVLLAASAEEGLQKARDSRPDLILLDHQLPGTTGHAVCCQLLEQAELKSIPVVISSTLRNRAYAEYTELSNVVDMLPKPYSAELLITTIANAISTASMVVQSQAGGTAVPEVIDELGESDLAGTFSSFHLREILDFLNNATKCGVLEVESSARRVRIFLDRGRIQAVTGSGIDPGQIIANLPVALKELSPVVRFTLSGRNCAEIDGLVELLDNKVLDPRLLRMLLRHQAATLLWRLFTGTPSTFRFEAAGMPPALFRKLPLESSALALLVDGAMTCPLDEIPPFDPQTVYVRNASRGQNLDRAGLSGQHMKLMGMLAQPIGIGQLVEQLNWPEGELRRVVYGFDLANLVQSQPRGSSRTVIAVTANPETAETLRRLFDSHRGQINGHVVRDLLAVKLLLRRIVPDVMLIGADCGFSPKDVAQIRRQLGDLVSWIGLSVPADENQLPQEDWGDQLALDRTVNSLDQPVLLQAILTGSEQADGPDEQRHTSEDADAEIVAHAAE